MPTLAELINLMILEFEKDRQILVTAALEAREAATHEESRSEDKHDTRGLEASYLAGAQAKRAEELGELIHYYKSIVQSISSQPLKKLKSITSPCILGLEIDDVEGHYFLIPRGSISKISIRNTHYSIITSQSPLGKELIGREAGSEFELKIAGKMKNYRIIAIH